MIHVFYIEHLDVIDNRYYNIINEYRYKGVIVMAREKFGTLTEPMFYVLSCLRKECCGMDIMERVKSVTGGRVIIGPGTLYHLLDDFAGEGMIVETRSAGRKRYYKITEKGMQMLELEYQRILQMAADYEQWKEDVYEEDEERTQYVPVL